MLTVIRSHAFFFSLALWVTIPKLLDVAILLRFAIVYANAYRASAQITEYAESTDRDTMLATEYEFVVIALNIATGPAFTLVAAM